MKVLVTGSDGFIGKNLVSHLMEKKDIEVISFDKNDSIDDIESKIENVDFIVHLAGVNRPKDQNEFIIGNTNLTKDIIFLLNKHKLHTPFLLTSSVQAELDNDYGRSKKAAEDLVLEYGEKAPAYVYRLSNVFGKWCKPNYNSVTATFCYNIANDLGITINDPSKKLTLVYIDDVVNEIINIIDGGKPSCSKDKYFFIEPKYTVTLQELADKINYMKKCMGTIYVPETGDDFTKKLFSTFISYYPVDKMAFSCKVNADERGSFTELIRTIGSGQFSVSVSKPGAIRGNHYHHTKMERFIVAKGKAKISFKSIIDGSSYELFVDENDVKIVTIPVGYSHSIENIGNDDMILIIWCNELYDEKHPDTYCRRI